MKTFFRPNLPKVVVAIVIAILNIGLAIYSAIAILCTQNCPAANAWQHFFSFTIEPLVVFKLASDFFEDMHFLPEALGGLFALFISLAILILFWYLLACVVLKIFSFFKHTPQLAP